jgi:hypothetical protein
VNLAVQISKNSLIETMRIEVEGMLQEEEEEEEVDK